MESWTNFSTDDVTFVPPVRAIPASDGGKARKRSRANTKIKRAGPDMEHATTVMADPADVKARQAINAAVDNVILATVKQSNTIENGFSTHFEETCREVEMKEVSEEIAAQQPPPATQRPIAEPVSQQHKILQASLFSQNVNRINVIDTMLSVIAYGVTNDDPSYSVETAMTNLPFVSRKRLESNLVEAHGKWPMCSRYRPDTNKQIPSTFAYGVFCAIWLCDKVEAFPIRAFFPGYDDAVVLAGGVPQDVPHLCALCQILETDKEVTDMKEGYQVAAPRVCKQRFYVSTEGADGFSRERCHIASAQYFHGIMLAFPRWFSNGFKTGQRVPHPDGLEGGLRSIVMKHGSAKAKEEKTQRFG